MKKYFCIIFIISINVFSQEKINVLFIGNSLTYYHDMPQTLQILLNEENSLYNIEQSTFPGMTLDSHLNSIIVKTEGESIETRTKETGEITETEKKIASKKWDIIILQENPGFQIFPDVMSEITIPTIEKIKKLVNNKECDFYLFNTWISLNFKYSSEVDCVPKHYFNWKKYYVNEEVSNKVKFCSKLINNEKAYLDAMNESFDSILKTEKISLTNHPNLHFSFREKYRNIKLYDDNYHPSEIGSFINACVFYKILTNRNATDLKYNGKLDGSIAESIKNFIDSNKSLLK